MGKKGLAVVLFLASSSVFLTSCGGSSVHYATYSDLEKLKVKVIKTEFATKQALSEIIKVKKTIKEINQEFKKQNKINEELLSKVKQVENRVEKVEKVLSRLKRHSHRKFKAWGNNLTEKVAVVITDFANFRSEPKFGKNVKFVLSKGTKVKVLKRIGDWYLVDFKGERGYMHKDVIVAL